MELDLIGAAAKRGSPILNLGGRSMNSTKLKRQQTGRRLKFTNDDLWGYIFIAAAMIIFCVFTLYPV